MCKYSIGNRLPTSDQLSAWTSSKFLLFIACPISGQEQSEIQKEKKVQIWVLMSGGWQRKKKVFWKRIYFTSLLYEI